MHTLYIQNISYMIWKDFFLNFICDLHPRGTKFFYIFQKKQNTGKCASCVQIINQNIKKMFFLRPSDIDKKFQF